MIRRKNIIKESVDEDGMLSLLKYVFSYLTKCEFELDNEEHQYEFHGVPKDSYEYEISQEFLDSLPNRKQFKSNIYLFNTPSGIYTNTGKVYYYGVGTSGTFNFGYKSDKGNSYLGVSVEISHNNIKWIDAFVRIPENTSFYNINIKE